MTCMSCREAFATENKNEIAGRIHAASPEICGCEGFSVSDHSPGPVSDSESLNIVISDPNSLLKDGSINPIILMRIDGAGVSSLRDAAENEEFEITIKSLRDLSASQGTTRFFHGVCVIPAALIRYDDAGNRYLCIYDTGLADKPHHADIFSPPVEGASTLSKTKLEYYQKLRYKQILERIGHVFVSAAKFRSGVFLPYTKHGSIADTSSLD